MKKWCDHINIMMLLVPVWKIVKGQTYNTGKNKKLFWYALPDHSKVPEYFKKCPICGKKRPTNDLNTGGLSES